MATPAAIPIPSTQAATSVPGQRHKWRRPRENDGGPTGQQAGGGSRDQLSNGTDSAGTAQPLPDASLSMRPASVASISQSQSVEASSAVVSAVENDASPRRRNYTGRGGALGHQRKDEANSNRAGKGSSHAGQGLRYTQGAGSRMNFQRQFGGRLTTGENTDAQSLPTSPLQANAPEFHPGQQYVQQFKSEHKRKTVSLPKANARIPRLRRGSSLKSTAPDIATRTHEDISHGIYDCPICTSEVGRSSKVWSCKTCWTVFHLSCIRKWSKNEGSTLAQQQTANGDIPPPRQWRCPGCNLPQDVLPSTYSCWCGKEVDPRPVSGIPPHSCGQTCGKPRLLPKKCPHPCELICHAGPCRPCTHIGPVQSCFCGKKSTSRRCVDTNYDTGWSCGEICGDLMPCGKHTCERSCHEGLCGACESRVDARCYCGKVQQPIICYERGKEKESNLDLTNHEGGKGVDQWVGMYNCGQTCGRTYDCGKHCCEKRCHPQEIEIPHCPRSADTVSHCPCGKTPLEEISRDHRQSCEDPIPNCNKECLKRLSCGHPCQQTCHSGECLPCLLTVVINCRCGRTSSSTMCHQGSEEQPQCMRICRVSLNCGRHECGERCCPGERKAAERQATKRKLRPLGSAPRAVEDGFEAEHICTRLCGRSLKCGNHTCPELCHKGACGSCREAIFDEINCHCGRTVLQPPLPCGTKPPSCRFDCERPKSCGHPQVQHNCHENDESCPKCPFLTVKGCMCGKKTLKNQPCWLEDVRCGEICGRKLKCGSHYCRNPCHKPSECEGAGKACQQACGKAKKACGHPCEETCHAPYSCREDKPCPHKLIITCDCQHLKQEMRCNASKTSDGNCKKTLTCDDECARLARNRKLALALNIDPEVHKDDRIPYSTDTLKMFQENIKWAQTQEREFRVFAADDTEKRLRFKPMQPHQRAFLHALAEDFGFDSESMDPDPHRHVAIFKTPKFVMAPMKTLAECVKTKPAVESTITTTADGRQKLNASNAPYNGFLLSNPRFGLTVEELRSDFSSVFASAAGITFDISFLPSEEIVLKANHTSKASCDKDVEAALKSLKSSLSTILVTKRLASIIQLCTLDFSLNILRRELDDTNNGGWSQVAAKAVAPRRAQMQAAVGTKSVYTVLGGKMAEAKRNKEQKEKERNESVVDDWEEEVRKEEEAERATCGGEEMSMGSTGLGEKDVREEGLPYDPINEKQATLGQGAAIVPQVDAVNREMDSKASPAVIDDKASSLPSVGS